MPQLVVAKLLAPLILAGLLGTSGLWSWIGRQVGRSGHRIVYQEQTKGKRAPKMIRHPQTGIELPEPVYGRLFGVPPKPPKKAKIVDHPRSVEQEIMLKALGHLPSEEVTHHCTNCGHLNRIRIYRYKP